MNLKAQCLIANVSHKLLVHLGALLFGTVGAKPNTEIPHNISKNVVAMVKY